MLNGLMMMFACLLDSCVECCVEWDGVVLRMSLYWVDSECKFSTAYARGCHAKTFGSFGGGYKDTPDRSSRDW